MKKSFLLCYILLSHINLFTSDSQIENYREIECKLIPILRLRDSNEDNILKNIISHNTHPNIPLLVKGIPSNSVVSNNWAGYVVGKNLANPSVELNTVSFVAGSWVVPTIKPSSHTTYCATWVGIDGFNNKTVEQIGTEQEYLVTNSFSGQYNYAWVEMFPQNAQIISGFPVANGDLIRGSVEYLSNNNFSLTLINHTKKVRTKIIRTLANPAQRICAEWIVEAPYLNGVLPLGNFGNITFRGCVARISGIQGAIKNSNWTRLGIRMATPNGRIKASISALNETGRSFNVKWQSQ